MPTAFDCFDMVSGFDTRIRVDAFDVYGPGASNNWVIDYSGDGSNNLFAEIQASGSTVVGLTTATSGRILYRQSSGVWDYLITGLAHDTLRDVPLCSLHSGEVWVSYDDAATTQGRISIVTSGSNSVQLGSTQLQGYMLITDGAYLYWMQRKTNVGSGTGALLTGSWTWDAIIGSFPWNDEGQSQQTLGGDFFNYRYYYNGTTGGVRTQTQITTGASGWPVNCRLPCVYSGVAYAVDAASGGTGSALWTMNSFSSGWVKTSITGGKYACAAIGGCVYYARTRTSGAYSGLMIYEYDIASATETLDAEFDVTGRSTTSWYMSINSTSVYLSAFGYVLRKDV